MKPKKLVKKLERSNGVRCIEERRMGLALTAVREAKRSPEQNDVCYARSGDTIAVCIKDHDDYDLMLCTVNMECDSFDGGDPW